MDDLVVEHVKGLYDSPVITVTNKTKGCSYQVQAHLTKEDLDIIMEGGALNYIRNHQ